MRPDLDPLVYAALRDLAARYWARHGAGHTLEPTSLVHEAWLKLRSEDFASREHYPLSAALSAASADP